MPKLQLISHSVLLLPLSQIENTVLDVVVHTHRPDLSAEILSHTTLVQSAIPLHIVIRKIGLERTSGSPFPPPFRCLEPCPVEF